MKRAADETASIDEPQLFCTVTAWAFSGRPVFRTVTRAMLGAEKLWPTQPTIRPSTASLGSFERESKASMAIFMRSSGFLLESALEKWPMGVRAPVQRTTFLDSPNMGSPENRDYQRLPIL